MQPPPTRRHRTRGHLVLMGGSVRAATESAAQDGWEVSAIDLFGDCDTRRAAKNWHLLPSGLDLETLLDRLSPGPLIVTGGMEQWYERLESVRNRRPVLAPTTEAIARLRDPAVLRSLALASGFQFPPCREPASTAVPPRPSSLWLRKSRRSTAGMGVATALSQSREGDEYFQLRVPGRPFGAAFLATDSSTRLLGVARSLTRSVGSTPFLYAGSIGPLPLEPEQERKLLRLAESIRSQHGLRGLFGIDLLVDRNAEAPWLLEINPRITASMELFESPQGPALITQHAAAYGFATAAKEWDELPAGFSSTGCVRGGVSSHPAPLRLKQVVWSRESFRWDPRWHPAAVGERTDVQLRDLPQPDSEIGRHQPVVSLCVAGGSIRECLRAAGEVERRLQRMIRASLPARRK